MLVLAITSGGGVSRTKVINGRLALSVQPLVRVSPAMQRRNNMEEPQPIVRSDSMPKK